MIDDQLELFILLTHEEQEELFKFIQDILDRKEEEK